MNYVKNKSLLHCLSLKKERIEWNGIESRALQSRPPRISWQGGKYPDIRRSSFSNRVSLRLHISGFTTLLHQVAMTISPSENIHRNNKVVYNLLLHLELIRIPHENHCVVYPWPELKSQSKVRTLRSSKSWIGLLLFFYPIMKSLASWVWHHDPASPCLWSSDTQQSHISYLHNILMRCDGA